MFVFGFLKPNSSVIRPHHCLPCVAADCASLALKEISHCAQLNQPHDVAWMSHGRPHVTFSSRSAPEAGGSSSSGGGEDTLNERCTDSLGCGCLFPDCLSIPFLQAEPH